MKILFLIITVFAFSWHAAVAQPKTQEAAVTTIASAHNMSQTLSKVKEALQGMSLNLVAEIDHAKAAADKGLELRPTYVLIFGNPMVGTNLMQADQRSGLDLPLRVLVWQDENGQVYLSHRHPTTLQQDYALREQQAVLAKMEKVFEKLGEVVHK